MSDRIYPLLVAPHTTHLTATFPLTSRCVGRQIIVVAQATAPEVRGAYVWTQLALPLAAAVALNAYGISALAQSEAPARLIPAPQELKPTFTLEDSERVSTDLNDLQGRPVIVHFFATWCEPCRVELPALQRLAERASTLRVLTISVAEPEARVRTFLDKMPLTFPVLLDRDRNVARSWKVSALPTTYILDANLQPRLFVESDYSWDQVDVRALENSLLNGGEQHAVPSP